VGSAVVANQELDVGESKYRSYVQKENMLGQIDLLDGRGDHVNERVLPDLKWICLGRPAGRNEALRPSSELVFQCIKQVDSGLQSGRHGKGFSRDGHNDRERKRGLPGGAKVPTERLSC
jgi:hypothetical protein